MRLTLHIRYLILFLVPALAVPRGVLLDLCVCQPEQELSCCHSCGGDEDSGPADLDCDSCGSIEIDDFQEALCPAPIALPAPVLTSAPPIVVLPPLQHVLLAASEERAPPERVTLPGLRSGTAPLRQ